jgi:hypothetical protein
MTKVFQRIARMVRNSEQQSLLRIFDLSLLQSKSVRFSVTVLKAIAEIVWWRQLRLRKRKRTTGTSSRLKRSLQSYSLSAAFACLLVVSSQLPQKLQSVAIAASTVQPPLSTQGARIVDRTGASVLLRGVNWFGMETDLHVPHGLWVRDYKEMLAQIKSQGYNLIRLPYSVQTLSSSNISGVNFSIGSNSDLQGKTPLEV